MTMPVAVTTEPVAGRERRPSARIPPVRGLIATQNRAGKIYRLIDVQRWIILNRVVHNTDKLDVLCEGAGIQLLPQLFETADRYQIRLSLRTDCRAQPENLDQFKRLGLFDVFLTPTREDHPNLREWLMACREAGLPVRVQLQAPFATDMDEDRLADALAAANVPVVNIALDDPALTKPPCTCEAESYATVAQMNRLAQALSRRNVEVNLIGLPFCYVYPRNLPHAENTRQFHLDHQQYVEGSYELFRLTHHHNPYLFSVTMNVMLMKHTLHHSPIDGFMLPFLLYRGHLRMIVGIYRRLTKRLRFTKGSAKPVDTSPEAYEREKKRRDWLRRRTMGPRCAACSLRRICDHETPSFRRVLPGLVARPLHGELVVSPMHFAVHQPKHYDAIDAARTAISEDHQKLADDAVRIITNRQPNRVVGPHDYAVEDCYYNAMESGLKWFSVSNVEHESTPLASLHPPFTIAVDFGAGIADYIGFSFGRHCKILCPMESYRHHLVLHVAVDGHYVLLRDRRPVKPVEFVDGHYLPRKIGSYVHPRISVWNIEDQIATQNVQIWEGAIEDKAVTESVKYSIIIVSTRFTRRLQAVLRAIAKQDYPMDELEVIVAYVPGIDATDDLIDSVSLAYPNLRILRAPFAEQKVNSKGFLINEAATYASGDWVMLLDSDTLIPPDMFQRIDAHADAADFIAPDGRKLLDKQTTHKILMGEIDSAAEWRRLLEGAGEFRHRETKGVPVGFCQCVRREHLDAIPYVELDYFEFSDMWFGEAMIKKFGKETRLSGCPVLHLDHGGSQWYGAQRHM